MRAKPTILTFIWLIFLASCAPAASITEASPAAPTTKIPPAIISTHTPASVPAPSPTPLSPTDTPDSNRSSLIVPRGEAALIDGTLEMDEWQLADQFELSGGGQLFLMHAEGYLYIGIRARPEPVTSICIDQGEQVSVLHSSAALGTAIYENAGEVWELVQDFEWCCRETTDSPQAQENRADHLEQNGWLANNGRMGVPEEVEFQIYMPEDQLRMAVTSIGAPDYEQINWWPQPMDDDCRNPQMIRGSIPDPAQFLVADWSLLEASPE